MGSLDQLAAIVSEVLRDAFDPPQDGIGISTRIGITVFLTSDRFEGMDDMERQEAVWGVLDERLTPEQRRAVAIVVALTPKERAFHEAAPTP